MKISYVYEDLGDPWYPQALEWFQESVSRIGCLSERMIPLSFGCPHWPPDNLPDDPVEKLSHFWHYWAWVKSSAGMMARENTVLSDVDVLWRRNPQELFEGDWDVGLCVRRYVLMPYNEAFILTKPTDGAKRFWVTYQVGIKQTMVWNWHAPQLIYGSIVGMRQVGEIAEITHPLAGSFRVKIFDMKKLFPAPDDEDYTGDAYALHFKGPKRRNLMEKYHAMQR